MPFYGFTYRHPAPDTSLRLVVAPTVRIVIEREPVPDGHYNRWQQRNRNDGTLAAEAMRWLKDTAQSGEPVAKSKPFTPEQRSLARDAYRMIRNHGVPEKEITVLYGPVLHSRPHTPEH